MPRNRMVKSTFWVEEAVVSCSHNARLLFIGLMNFCDDVGIHPVSYLTLKMEVFPGDDYSVDDIKRWVAELINNGLIREYGVTDKLYWIILGWENRQTINRPTPSHYPPPESGYKQITQSSNPIKHLVNTHSVITDDSVSVRTVLTPNIKEENIKEEKKDIVVSDTDSIHYQPIQNCPQEEIKALYQEILPMCRQVRVWNKKRSGYLQARWREDKKHQSLDFWRWYFESVRESKFLTGQVASKDGRPLFRADLEWLLNPNNFAKVIEGKYNE